MNTIRKLLLLLVAGVVLGIVPVTAQVEELPEDVTHAFSLSFETFFFVSMMSAFGQTIPGVEIDDESIVFDGLDLATLQLSERRSYTKMDGTINSTETESGDADMRAELTLTGGPVRSLVWTVQNFSIDSPEAYFEIVADGKSYRYGMSD